MEFFRFCLEIIRREAKRFNVGIKNSTVCQLTAATADDINYDDAHNRCAFLYRCGTINLSFAKDCFSKFLTDSNGIEYLLGKWRFDKYLTVCSISKGPALDYIALLLSDEQCKILTSLIGNIKIVTKHGAWRNTANIMLDIMNEGYFNHLSPSIANVEVIQGDPFNNFTQKVKLPVNDSDMIIMVKTLNLQSDGYDKEKISKAIQEFLDAVKPGAVLFCIDTKPSIKEITYFLTAFSGKFLFQPTPVCTMINLEYRDLYKAQFGCLPIISGRGYFFVWEKSSVSTSNIKCELKDTQEPVENTFNIPDRNYEVIPDKSRQEFSCSKELSEYFDSYSTPKLSEEINDVKCNLREMGFLADNVNSNWEKLRKVPTPDLLNESFPPVSSSFKTESLNSLISLKCDKDFVFDPNNDDKSLKSLKSTLSPISLENESVSLLNYLKIKQLENLKSLKSQLNLASNSESFQKTELSKETEITKVTELTNKIADLTVELAKLLENGTLKDNTPNNCSKCSEEMCKPLGTKSNSCSSIVACARLSQNFKRCCCCQKCAYHHLHLPSSSHASLCDKTSNCCRSLSATKSNILNENIQSSAQIVIPLNNLSTNVISQIISLINESNK